MRLIRLFSRQDGLALPLVVGMITVLTISVSTLTYYSATNSRSASQSKEDTRAFSLSEAAFANAMAILNNPSNNALDSDLLPSGEATASSAAMEGGTAKWWGVLDRNTAVWTVTGLGIENGPTGSGVAQVRRKLTAKVPVVPTYTQPLNTPSWNYIYNRRTGNTCDMTINNNVTGSSRLYVKGNLCLTNNVVINNGPLVVQGNLDLTNNASVGAATSMSTRVETYVGGNCRYNGGSWAIPCTGNQDSRKLFSKKDPPSYVIGVNNNAPVVAEPAADFAAWYENAIPGPAQPCTASSGTPPTFDNNYPTRNNSAGTFNLVPSSSYMCRVGPGANTTLTAAMDANQTTLSVASASGFPASTFRIRIDDEQMTVTGGFGTTTWTVTRGVNGTTAASHVNSQTVNWDDANTSGILIWNAATKTLTVKGTIYIDGSVSVTNQALNMYNGQASLYLSGTLTINNGSKLCGGVSGSNCDFANWNPNNELLTIVTDGSSGGNGVTVEDNGQFQGGLFATNNVYITNNTHVDGPIVGNEVIINNNLQTDGFPTITNVPVGMPGNPTVYAQPNPPQLFAG